MMIIENIYPINKIITIPSESENMNKQICIADNFFFAKPLIVFFISVFIKITFGQ